MKKLLEHLPIILICIGLSMLTFGYTAAYYTSRENNNQLYKVYKVQELENNTISLVKAAIPNNDSLATYVSGDTVWIDIDKSIIDPKTDTGVLARVIEQY